MRIHRSSHDRVPNKHQPDNFQPSDAIERLHAAILRVDTITQIASSAADQLPCPSAPAARRAFTRMQILVGKAADEATTALAEGDRLLAELAQHMQLATD